MTLQEAQREGPEAGAPAALEADCFITQCGEAAADAAKCGCKPQNPETTTRGGHFFGRPVAPARYLANRSAA
jgi:hypothetical protein